MAKGMIGARGIGRIFEREHSAAVKLFESFVTEIRNNVWFYFDYGGNGRD